MKWSDSRTRIEPLFLALEQLYPVPPQGHARASHVPVASLPACHALVTPVDSPGASQLRTLDIGFR